MIGSCGLNCLQCEAYLATQEDNDDMRAEVAKKWSVQYKSDIRPEHINCDGCLSKGRKFFFCQDICEVRKCCIEKEIAHCALCDMYLCDKLQNFIEQAPVVGKALEKLREQCVS